MTPIESSHVIMRLREFWAYIVHYVFVFDVNYELKIKIIELVIITQHLQMSISYANLIKFNFPKLIKHTYIKQCFI